MDHKADDDTREILPTTLCGNTERIVFQGPDNLFCLNGKDGKVLWKTPRPVERDRLRWSAPTVVLYGDVVFSADGKERAAKKDKKKKKAKGDGGSDAGDGSSDTIHWTFSAAPSSSSGGELVAFRMSDGKELWRCPAAFGYSSPPDLFVVDGLVWVSSEPGLDSTDVMEWRDPHTGEVKKKIDSSYAFDCAHHHRCYRDKATDNYVLMGRTGIEFIDLQTDEIQRHFWIRGTCQYGIMPANGMIYAPGNSCGCYIQSKVDGFLAVAPKNDQMPESVDEQNRLATGPGYQKATTGTGPAGTTDWPMFRHDAGRSASTVSPISKDLKKQWEVSLSDGHLRPGGVGSPVVADGVLLVAIGDQNKIVAIDENSGRKIWELTADGPIDSPPSIYKGYAIFGSHDGYVYSLVLKSGELAWRFRAAPNNRQMYAFGKLESAWPVVGSVLVYKDTVYATAGRTSYLDSGMSMFLLDPVTGKEKGRSHYYSRDAKTGQQPDSSVEDVEMPGMLPDVLVVEGGHIFMRDSMINEKGEWLPGQYLPHMYSSAGLLNDVWWHRTDMLWAERAWGRASGVNIAPRYRPSGKMLDADGDFVFGYDVGKKGGGEIFKADKKVEKVDEVLDNNNKAVVKYMTPDKVVTHWSANVDIRVRAMVKSNDIIAAAGPESSGEIDFNYVASKAWLKLYDAGTGQLISSADLPAQPVFNGMAAANSKVFISTVDNKITCLK